MDGIKICKRCNKKILVDEKGVCLNTFQGNKSLEKVYWHWQCYLDWRDESLEIRAKKIYNTTMMACIPNFKDMLNQMGRINNEETKPEDILLQMGIS